MDLPALQQFIHGFPAVLLLVDSILVFLPIVLEMVSTVSLFLIGNVLSVAHRF